ncbi:Ohr family peroxiredoxin [Baekduia alba]|uniref:Ohr family peroxiredoxin n=1 Tax=Baekduia alba TaxID=2997333 RepID=UPI002341A40B|nr:Ohr family peroxiredoxin [Baekduia alba]
MSEVVYTAQANVTGGRRGGRGETSDGNLSVALETPGTGGQATNPEQLFAVGYAACFASAVAFTALRQKVETGPVAVDSSVSLLKDGLGAFDLAVELRVTLPAVDADAAVDLVRAAHETCPYSRATRGNLDVALIANGQPV